MLVKFVSFKDTGNDSQEGNSISVSGIDVGVNFKNKTAEVFLCGFYKTGIGFSAFRSGSNLNELIQ